MVINEVIKYNLATEIELSGPMISITLGFGHAEDMPGNSSS